MLNLFKFQSSLFSLSLNNIYFAKLVSEFTTCFLWSSCYSIIVSCIVFYRSLSLLSFFFWSFYHLFFDLRLPITPFMSDFEVPLFLSTGISFAIFHGSKNQPVCSNLLYNSERRYLRTVAEAFKYCIYKNADGNTGLDVCPIVRYQ